jgi:hypothetical protein
MNATAKLFEQIKEALRSVETNQQERVSMAAFIDAGCRCCLLVCLFTNPTTPASPACCRPTLASSSPASWLTRTHRPACAGSVRARAKALALAVDLTEGDTLGFVRSPR